jgi:hypothetical protein
LGILLRHTLHTSSCCQHHILAFDLLFVMLVPPIKRYILSHVALLTLTYVIHRHSTTLTTGFWGSLGSALGLYKAPVEPRIEPEPESGVVEGGGDGGGGGGGDGGGLRREKEKRGMRLRRLSALVGNDVDTSLPLTLTPAQLEILVGSGDVVDTSGVVSPIVTRGLEGEREDSYSDTTDSEEEEEAVGRRETSDSKDHSTTASGGQQSVRRMPIAPLGSPGRTRPSRAIKVRTGSPLLARIYFINVLSSLPIHILANPAYIGAQDSIRYC